MVVDGRLQNTILPFMDAKNVSLLNLSPSQLRKAAGLKERIDGLMNELAQILDGTFMRGGGNEATNGHSGKRTLSAVGRRRIAEAARARWAKIRAAKGQSAPAAPSNGGETQKRTMSPAARKKIAAAARARWAKIRAEKAKA
jgi:hypothetical protein